jgi:hypothetical protein
MTAQRDRDWSRWREHPILWYCRISSALCGYDCVCAVQLVARRIIRSIERWLVESCSATLRNNDASRSRGNWSSPDDRSAAVSLLALASTARNGRQRIGRRADLAGCTPGRSAPRSICQCTMPITSLGI